jgi:OOP family OmpA-OmpF porin
MKKILPASIKHLMTPGLLALAAFGMLAAPAARADEPFVNPQWADSAWYIGAGVGRSKASIDELAIAAALRAGGPIDARVNVDEGSKAWKIIVGKQLNHNFAIEGGYQDMGKFDFNGTATPGAGIYNGHASFRAFNLDLIAQMTMTERFSIYARLGGQYVRSKASFTGNRLMALTAPNQSESEIKPHLGLGLEYKLTEALALRAEAERARTMSTINSSGKLNLVSLALVYKLGRPADRPAYVAPPAPAPAPVVETPPPPPPAPAPAPKPAPQPRSEKATFSAQTLFDFDKSELKPAGKEALDKLMAQQQGIDLEVMIVVGHTDAIGTDAYNQALSLRRAASVKAYLTGKGAPDQKVFTEGKGESQPVADNKTAEGRTENRRVTVEVVGTRMVK